LIITTYLLLGENPDHPVTWLRVNSAGQLENEGRADNYSDFVNIQGYLYRANETLIALLPGEFAALRILSSPPKAPGQFLSAAQYLLEDDLAEDIDNLHVCISTENNSQHSPQGLCVGVSKTIVNQWHDSFTKNDLFPAQFSIDFLYLPVAGKNDHTKNNDKNDDEYPNISYLTLFSHAEGILGRADKGGFSLDHETAPDILSDIINQWNIDHIDYYGDQHHADILMEKISSSNGTPPRIKFNLVAQANLQNLAKLFTSSADNAKKIPNLLSGSYQLRYDWRKALKPWIGTGIATSLCVALLASHWILSGLRIAKNTDRLTELSSTIHKEHFPEANDQDPVQHARSILTGQKNNLQFLDLWTRFATVIDQFDTVQLNNIGYTANRSILRASINVDNLDALAAFKSALADLGIQAEEGRMKQTQNGQYSGDLTVRL